MKGLLKALKRPIKRPFLKCWERLFLIVEGGGIFMANTDTFSYIYMYLILDRTNTVQLNEPTLSNMLQHSSFAL